MKTNSISKYPEDSLACTVCGDEAYDCKQCGSIFVEGEEIFCNDFNEHFCKECAEKIEEEEE